MENQAGSGSRDTVIKSNGIVGILKKSWVLGLLLFAVSFLIYAPSLGNDFVWDDRINIQKQNYKFENSSVFANVIPGAREIKRGGYYRPVISSSIVLDYKIWGENPFGFHLTNNLLFSFSSLLFFFLVLMILRDFHIGSREYIAAVSALVYIVHPMHVESVSWIAGRSDIICTFFFLAAFIFHILSYRKIVFFPAVLLMLALSFLSKEIAIVFPFLALAYDLLRAKKFELKRVYISSFYFLLLIAYFLVRGRSVITVPELSYQTLGISGAEAVGIYEYMKAVWLLLNTYGFYFIKLIFPFSFNAFISEVPKEAIYTMFSVLIFSIISVTAYISARFKTGIKAFGLIWLVLTLAPSALVAVIQISTTPLAERYLFLPICGFALICAYAVSRYLPRPGSKKTIILLILGFSVLAYCNINRQSVWADRISFWDNVSHKADNSVSAKINHGIALIENNQIQQGIDTLESIFVNDMKASNSHKSVAANNLALGYYNLQEYESAKKWFKLAIRYNPDFVKSYYHLGLIDYIEADKTGSRYLLERAEKYALKAVEIDKRYARAHLLLGRIYVEYGDLERAKKYARNALNSGLEIKLQKFATHILEMN